ncbi:host specificity protein J [Salmonella enterica]|nr:host specificity protein J [Salmonella enterica]
MSKGGGKQHTPREYPDNLKSMQELSVIDVIGEGPIQGPVNGLQSLLLNDTPVVDAQGGVNVHGVEAQFRSGEDHQSPLEGFDGSAAETLIQAEVTHDKPITRTITSEVVDRLRVTVGVQALQQTTDKGDRIGTSVQMDIQIQQNGIWSTVKSVIINDGKRTSPYMAAVIINNLPPRPFNIRVVRITEDSTSDMLQNKTVWQGLTEIINITQSYPDTALVGLKVDADQFGSQSVSRKFHFLGRIVLVPSSYDPKTRTYAGLWDGTFKPAYTNNPAWIILDLLTHPRYGLGQRIGLADVDKWALYAIAQYCDQPVPNGFGQDEPRMTCNVYLADRRKAYDVISDFCSVMRCMWVWTGQKMTFIQDRPSDKVWTYTNANVVNGEFNYSYSAAKDRHNAAEIRFIDPQNGWNVSVELVEDKADIAKNGRKVLQMDAFGCTSRGQAHRTGLWVIQTELLETQMVTFGVGAEGLRHTPGDIFEVCDNDLSC